MTLTVAAVAILALLRPLPRAAVAAARTDAEFVKAHESFLQRSTAGPIGVLFLGDSITAGWFWDHNKEIWDRAFGRYQPANFGIGGDKTENVLWRIDHGELNRVKPRVVVLLIGTNNIDDPAADILAGVKAVAKRIHHKLPKSRLLLLGIFPRGADPAQADVAEMRAKIREVNAGLAKLDDGDRTRFLDIGGRFLSPDGKISPQIMPDALHINDKGYAIWAAAMQPLLDAMMSAKE
jgi:lysophospholipase L1-like esterase